MSSRAYATNTSLRSKCREEQPDTGERAIANSRGLLPSTPHQWSQS